MDGRKPLAQIGGSDATRELAELRVLAAAPGRQLPPPIDRAERQQRLQKALDLMQEQQIAALILPAGSSLLYFTGLSWYPSERLVAAMLTPQRGLEYFGPAFEESKLGELLAQPGCIAAPLHVWQEEQDPCALLASLLNASGLAKQSIALDEQTPFFIYDALRQVLPEARFVNGKTVTAACRMQKSAAEIALLQAAKNLTLEVHKRAARILREGITASEVMQFIDQAHRCLGVGKSTFCIVGFGAASAIPHGVEGEQYLQQGDMVLIDTGCRLHGYHADITRSYVFGEPSARQREVWNVEKAAQAAAFAAAQIGQTCGSVDAAARRVLEAAGFGPGYALPGLPHRTGHGIGLDIHEWPYLVKDNPQVLAPGMCFSNEPMLVLEGEFGIRLEDHFYMTEQGPRWFTEPSVAIDQPFAD